MADINLWLLVAVTALVVEFGRELADEKNTDAMLVFARRIGGKSGRMWSLMLMPALIGLVPMSAGALFSAAAGSAKRGRGTLEAGMESGGQLLVPARLGILAAD